MSTFTFDHDLILYAYYKDPFTPHIQMEKGNPEACKYLKVTSNYHHLQRAQLSKWWILHYSLLDRGGSQTQFCDPMHTITYTTMGEWDMAYIP